MKILIIGQGSMGKRRVRNLKHLGVEDIVVFDPREERRLESVQKYGVRAVATIEAAWEEKPDAVVISTPPDLHLPYQLECAKRGIHFFSEASVVPEGAEELIELCQGKDFVAAPSCTMRFWPEVRKIRELTTGGELGRPVTYTYHSGQYLPDWHPYEAPKDFYVSKKQTGGCREIVPFELVWLVWAFGGVSRVEGMRDHVSDLDLDIDDVYQMLMRHEKGVLGHLLVDVVARDAVRALRVLLTEGTIEWIRADNVIRVYRASTKAWETIKFEQGVTEAGYINSEVPYIEEMTRFLKAVRGEEPFGFTLEEDHAVLGLMVAAERSSDRAFQAQA